MYSIGLSDIWHSLRVANIWRRCSKSYPWALLPLWLLAKNTQKIGVVINYSLSRALPSFIYFPLSSYNMLVVAHLFRFLVISPPFWSFSLLFFAFSVFKTSDRFWDKWVIFKLISDIRQGRFPFRWKMTSLQEYTWKEIKDNKGEVQVFFRRNGN